MKVIKVLIEGTKANVTGVEIEGKECIAHLGNTTGEVLETWDMSIEYVEKYLKHGLSALPVRSRETT